MGKRQRRESSSSVTEIYRYISNTNGVRLTHVENKEKKASDNLHFIFQNIPITNEGERLTISPGYIVLNGLGAKQQVSVFKEGANTQMQKLSNPKLSVDRPNILQISDLQITAIGVGRAILKVEENGFSDSIRVDVKA